MVPVVDLSRRDPEMDAAYLAAVARVLGSGHLLLGPETEALESELAAWAGTAHAVGLASGAAAIQLALSALGIGEGDEVLVPAFTAVPTASAVWATGARPVFVDVDPLTATVPGAAWEDHRTDRTRAVVVVHLYGRPAEAPRTDLPVIDDAAQAHGAFAGGLRRGSVAAAYSFYPTKNLGGIGDGGAIVTDDADLAVRLRRLRVHGMEAQYVHVERSQNFRMSEIEAAWLRIALPQLGRRNEDRRAIAARLRAAASTLRWQEPHTDHVHHLAVLRAHDRTTARAVLAAAGVASAVHYPLALTEQPAFRDLTRAACPHAEAWARECVTVPCFPTMRDDEIDRVAVALDVLAANPAAGEAVHP